MIEKWIFQAAGLYGLLVITPQYFLENRVGQDHPPAVTHPEFYYGFVGVALAWQVAFLVIAQAPQRYRPLIIPGILEKVSFGFAALILIAQGRSPAILTPFALLDLLLAGLFAYAWVRLGRATPSSPASQPLPAP